MPSLAFSPAHTSTPSTSTVRQCPLTELSLTQLTFFGCFVADEGGATRMSGGIPWLTLPAGYLGSSFIGAVLIVCGFNTNASKIASLVLAGFFLFTLWWARRDLT